MRRNEHVHDEYVPMSTSAMSMTKTGAGTPPPRPNRPVYLDNQATTRCDPRVLSVMLPWFSEHYGNPASVEHVMGTEAETAVEEARAQVAALLGADVREVVFTSGATESNNIAIKGAARYALRSGSDRRRVVTVATEHKCVLESAADLKDEGFEPVFLPVRPDGLLDPDVLREALAVPTVLVSVMTVNNETGVVQDIATLAAIARQAGALFHTDAAQGVGKVPIDVTASKIDLLSLSGHKIYGPKGVGALYVRRRPRVRLVPLFSGGGQERGLRSGTLPAWAWPAGWRKPRWWRTPPGSRRCAPACSTGCALRCQRSGSMPAWKRASPATST
jgi:cysteine desulfurase